MKLMRPEAAGPLARMGTLPLLCALDLAAYENRYPFSQVYGVYPAPEDGEGLHPGAGRAEEAGLVYGPPRVMGNGDLDKANPAAAGGAGRLEEAASENGPLRVMGNSALGKTNPAATGGAGRVDGAASENGTPRVTGNSALDETYPVTTGGAGCFYGQGAAWALSSAAAEEVAALLQADGRWETLWCDQAVAAHLGAAWKARAVSLTARDIAGKLDAEVLAPRPEEVYRLLGMCDALAARTPFDGWYCDLSHRARRGQRSLWGIRAERELVSTATADVLEDHILLRDIATRPDMRGRGFCTRILWHLFAKFPGRTFHLLTESETARRVYEKAGFEIENDGIIRIHKENTDAAGIF
ncbi:GNAT family N-acetyltransferase [Zongyangia hominis]|uniref:GNAT family N-acetyltransferase n=1 Tax=Zongyangia hominis TaxID=2763677 RepID=A0A926I6Q5_9FIRM|nr:GNAT family N-acetyltransferase [Zongyangia hominis]MBC8570299.1 GNAT family N-acetyltransferase [Zongyangia hominis]